jgi:lipopolysaccharide export system permease protein
MIKVLDRYLLKSFFKAAFLSLFVFLVIYLIIDVIEHLDDYIDNQAALSTVLRYYQYYFPFIIVQVIPVAVLLAAMFSIGLMARRNELLALNSSGVSLYRIAQPLLLGGLLISVAIFLFSDRIVPEANRRKAAIKYGEIEKNPNYGREQVRNLIYLGRDARVFRFASYNPLTKTAQNVQIQTILGNRLRSQLNCRMMYWEDSVWIAVGGQHREFHLDSNRTGSETLTQFDKQSEIIAKGTDKDLGFNMSLDDLARIIEYHRLAARDTEREEVYYQIKFSLPLASFIIVLLAVPLASDPRRGSLAIGFAFSAGIAFVYILLFEIGQKLGTEGTIPPAFAAWGANALFFVVGLILMIKARK